ncbi:MAG: hypothetical protein CFE38_08100 [Comamonadaceae bacterium PBBC1]|nr:MAG: hypothetical protein CFE38_08100 [Comamonadaceae bacterium PBBC1]
MKAINKKLGLLAICAGALTLVACGGDSATVPLTVRGVVATGLAIEGGSVVVDCVSGTGTAPTLANGSYSVTIQNGQGPCLVTVTKGAVVLRSMSLQTTSGTAVANVTPFSNAIVNALVTAKGAGTVSGLINSATAPSNSDLTAAVSAVVAQINVALIAQSQPPLDPNTDLLGKADYVAATTASPGIGDAVDKALDFLVTGTTLPPTLVTAINQATDTVVDPTPTGGTGGF